MPTVTVGRDRLFQALGRTYTKEEFDELCFDFGIELDEETTAKAIADKEKHLESEDNGVVEEEEILYKIEVPANRYDLLCLEGIARALRIFIGVEETPVYRCVDIPDGSMLEMHVKPETYDVRPFVVCAVLRGITFNEASYKSFIDLQDKLHQNICRKRTLVAIGTHDLDTIQAPFSYEALPPSEISFVPLKQAKTFRADELMEYYESDLQLKKFLHILKGSKVYPVIYDRNRTVLSLPPIINGAHSAIGLKTKNVFIECTATDLTKAKIVLNTVVTMFSEYCERKYEVETVKVLYPDKRTSEIKSSQDVGSQRDICPDLSVTRFRAHVSEITGRVGISLTAAEVIPLLKKMQLQAEESLVDDNRYISVSVPPTRSDILHSCDLAEDVAIAFGYNNIAKLKPDSMTIGQRQPLSLFTDKIRLEVCKAGYMEVVTWILGSEEENFTMLKRENDKVNAVIIGNPRTSDYKVARASLMAGLLKSLKSNIDHPRPIKIFEVGDVVMVDDTNEVGASNNRRLAALYCNVTSGFEVILGLVDRIMKVAPKIKVDDYKRPSNEPQYLPKRQCNIFLQEKMIGSFGVIHPEVLKNFGIVDPCTYVEIDIQALL